jgi:arylsulfatase A-like enzyme
MLSKKIFSTLSVFACMLLAGNIQAQQKNILFIAVDDLRPQLGCYGDPVVQSPNMDKLASSGVRFAQAYCNIPVCGATRASIMSGLRPNASRFINYDCYLDKDVPGVVSLPMHFRNNGYQTVSLGKVFHHQFDSKGSWDENWRPKNPKEGVWQDYQLPENIAANKSDKQRALPYEKADLPDDAYFDGKIAAKAIEELQAAKQSGKPFFMAVGFLKPHLPFNAPAKYWDLYPEASIKLPDNMHKPKDAPDASMHTFGELRAYSDIPPIGPVSNDMALKLIQGYYACVSYTDAQVGKVLKALDALGLADNTIVVLWGDHGWNLGEHGLWCKHCNFKNALHTPLMIRAPGFKTGIVANQLVEYVDVYPTLCDLAAVPKPFHLQGNSLTPLLNGENPAWKDAVFSRWIKGETIITQSHAYTEWYQQPGQPPYARMLFDHTTDAGENVNISEDPANRQLVEALHKRIEKHIAERDQIRLPVGKK